MQRSLTQWPPMSGSLSSARWPPGRRLPVTDGLRDTFGSERCFGTPLEESAIIGISLGLAIRGFRSVPEIQFNGLSYPAFDQISSHLAEYRNRTRGALPAAVTIRIPSFGGIGSPEHYSESSETYFVHTAGLHDLTPATPADAYRLLRYAIESDDRSSTLSPSAGAGPKATSTLISPANPSAGRSCASRESTSLS